MGHWHSLAVRALGFCSRSGRSVDLDCLHSAAMERDKELQGLYSQCSALPKVLNSAQLHAESRLSDVHLNLHCISSMGLLHSKALLRACAAASTL